MNKLIDINGLINEFKKLDMDASIYVNSDLDYTLEIDSNTLLDTEMDIIQKYAKIEAIKIKDENTLLIQLLENDI